MSVFEPAAFLWHMLYLVNYTRLREIFKKSAITASLLLGDLIDFFENFRSSSCFRSSWTVNTLYYLLSNCYMIIHFILMLCQDNLNHITDNRNSSLEIRYIRSILQNKSIEFLQIRFSHCYVFFLLLMEPPKSRYDIFMTDRQRIRNEHMRLFFQ